MELHIAGMLRAQKKHLSFHTPGHKRAGADITELSYSDNLADPRGVLMAAERDIASVLGANRSFLLTDGSTCGIFSMIYSARAAGARSLAAPEFSHPSVLHACEVMGLALVPIAQRTEFGIPLPPDEEEIGRALSKADALLVTSPDYYGNFPPLGALRELCGGKPLLIDGAHGGHLHGEPLYAGRYADLWVDGVHKSLPALTQGAVVSARTAQWGELLKEAVLRFRTSSPSYPIMASVEYAVKYPKNGKIEAAARAFKREFSCAPNADWTKLLVPFGEACGAAQAELEKRGVYPEFNDGNYLMFYLSPRTRQKDLKILGKRLKKLPRGSVEKDAPCGKISLYTELT